MHAHTWEDPEIKQIRTQNETKQDDWPKETWKKCPIKVIQTTRKPTLSPSLPLCAYSHVLFFLLIHTSLISLLSVSLWKFIFRKATRARALSLATGLVARIQRSRCHSLTSVSGQESKSCFKLLQAKATQDHAWAIVAENLASVHWCRIKSQRQSFGWSRKEELYCFARQRVPQWAHAPHKLCGPTREGLVRSFIAVVQRQVAGKEQGVYRACTPLAGLRWSPDELLWLL